MSVFLQLSSRHGHVGLTYRLDLEDTAALGTGIETGVKSLQKPKDLMRFSVELLARKPIASRLCLVII